MPPPRPLLQDRRSGFALLITITLLAFLVLLLVSLATLTRVETRVASNSQQLSQARQNALMALNIALGRLQATAGPDTRITATADLVAGRSITKKYWTGVWNAAASGADKNIAWLVSGTAPAGATGVIDTLTAATGNSLVELIGANSTDTSLSATTGNSVKAETQPIKSDSVPGLPGTQTIGNFAYWVGDEGVKAKVSLTDPGAASAATADEKAFRLKLAQRSGIELVEAGTGSPLAANYPANDTGLSKVLDLKQLPLANPGGQTALATAVKNRFPDLTACSYSVLADVSQGGLKKDLTAWLAYPASSLAGGAPADGDPLFPQASGDSTGFGLPKWGIIRSFAGLHGGPTQPLPPQVQTDRQQGFGPVATYFRLGFSAYSPTPADPTASSNLIAQAFPVLVLWNPYDTPIAASSYEFVFGFRWNSNVIKFSAGNPPTTFKGSLLLTSAPQLVSGGADGNSPDGGNASRRFLRFTVNSPQMVPGESLVFTLDRSGDYLAPGLSGAIALSPNNPAATDRSVFFSNPSVTLTAAERAQKIRVFISGNPWLQMGLYPTQPLPPASGSDPTVQDMVAQNPYSLLLSMKPGSQQNTDINVSPFPSIEPKGAYVWLRSQMSGYANYNNQQFYTNPRWLAQLNPRAPYHFLMSPGSLSTGGTLSMVGDNSQSNPNASPNDKFDGNKASAGSTIDAAPPSIPTTNLRIAGLAPSTAQPESRLFSLAQLQHANLSLMGQTAGSAVGNSEVNFIMGDPTRTGVTVPASDQAAPASQLKWFYDTSYLLNQALWDRYFFSTLPQALTADQINDPAFHLPNARHGFYAKDGVAPTPASLSTDTEAFNTAAAGLLVNGGFNINSTSEQAWRALLASHNNVDPSAPAGFSHPYARFSSTQAGDPANTTDWSSGYRILSDAQINLLAQKIVAEVKTRGPFLSLADFVNRRLKNDATGLKGALQAAIDATNINDNAPFNSPAHRVGPMAYYPATAPTLLQKQLFLADFAGDDTRPASSRAAFAPGFLTQADLLSSLGPVLMARSDTFRIRTYGETVNSATGLVEAKAWCEAVVQRTPDYVESTVDAWAIPAAGTPSATFGRRFKIVSFRWLSPADI